MPAESKKLDTKCLEPFGGEIGGLSFDATHSGFRQSSLNTQFFQTFAFFFSHLLNKF